MTRWLAPLLLSACWNAPPPVETPKAAPPEPAVDVRIPDECIYDRKDQAVPTKLAAGGTIAMITCSLGRHAYDETEADNEDALTVEDFAVYLVRRGVAPFAEQIGDWQQGWEWGSSWDFEGVLEAKAGGAPLVLTTEHNHQLDVSTSTIYAYRIDPSGPVQIASFSSDSIRIEIDANGETAVIERCVPRDDVDPDVECLAQPEMRETITLTWNGAKLVERRAP